VGHFTLLAPVPVVAGLLSVSLDFDIDSTAIAVGFCFLIGVALLWTATLRHVVCERAGRSGKLRPRHRVLIGLIGMTGLFATILMIFVTLLAVEKVTRYVNYNW
jgi:ACR3 family arsenite efflux pump ArsB